MNIPVFFRAEITGNRECQELKILLRYLYYEHDNKVQGGQINFVGLG